MYLISWMVVLILFTALTMLSAGGDPSMAAAYLDIPSLLSILIIVIPILFLSGLGRPFFYAFRMTLFPKRKFPVSTLKKSCAAIELAGKTSLVTGGMVSLFGLILVFSGRVISEQSQVLPSASVACISFLYGMVIYILLLPLQFQLRRMIYDRELEDHGQRDKITVEEVKEK